MGHRTESVDSGESPESRASTGDGLVAIVSRCGAKGFTRVPADLSQSLRWLGAFALDGDGPGALGDLGGETAMALRLCPYALNCDGAMKSASICVICGQYAMVRWLCASAPLR
jgi:hypothetical protein